MSATSNPLKQSAEPVAWNFKLLAQNDLGGFGGMGEGMAVQIAKDGRRIIWLAHESAPKNFTGVDVSDPRKPKVVVQTDLPQSYMRSNSLELSGDIMAVAYQTQKTGQKPAGLELFDVSVPEKPRSISFFDCSGANSRGVHQLWFCDGEYVHMAAGAPDFEPSNPLDDQFYRCIDVRNPAKPVEVGRWWMPGTRQTRRDAAAAAQARQGLSRAQHQCLPATARPALSRLHRRRHVHHGHRRQIEAEADLALDQFAALHRLHAHGAAAVLARSADGDRRVDREQRQGWPKLIWLLDNRDEKHPVSISTCPMPPLDAFKDRGGRFGAHNIHENPPVPTAWQSDGRDLRHVLQRRLARLRHRQSVSAEGNRGLRAAGAERNAGRRVQLNDVFVDERGIVYTVDRYTGGLYMLEMDF